MLIILLRHFVINVLLVYLLLQQEIYVGDLLPIVKFIKIQLRVVNVKIISDLTLLEQHVAIVLLSQNVKFINQNMNVLFVISDLD